MNRIVVSLVLAFFCFGCAENQESVSRTKKVDLGEEIPCVTQDPEANTFCGYQKQLARCEMTVLEELEMLSSTYSFIELVDIGSTSQETPIRGVRIGVQPTEEASEIPQSIIISAQHGDEAATTEVIMRTIRSFKDAYIYNLGGTQNILKKSALVFIPVANPDGYDQMTNSDVGERANLGQCPDGRVGVDLNRNNVYAWKAPGTLLGPTDCGTGVSPGPSPESESETNSLLALIDDDYSYIGIDKPKQFETFIVANVHTRGASVTIPQGIDSGGEICGVQFDGRNNCTSPDLAVFNAIFGTERPSKAVFFKEGTLPGHSGRLAYDVGPRGRMYPYAIGGGLTDTVQHGFVRSETKRVSALIERVCPSDFCEGAKRLRSKLKEGRAVG